MQFVGEFLWRVRPHDGDCARQHVPGEGQLEAVDAQPHTGRRPAEVVHPREVGTAVRPGQQGHPEGQVGHHLAAEVGSPGELRLGFHVGPRLVAGQTGIGEHLHGVGVRPCQAHRLRLGRELVRHRAGEQAHAGSRAIAQGLAHDERQHVVADQWHEGQGDPSDGNGALDEGDSCG